MRKEGLENLTRTGHAESKFNSGNEVITYLTVCRTQVRRESENTNYTESDKDQENVECHDRHPEICI